MECQRCGECCHYTEEGKKKPCRFLKILKNGKTFCKNYKNRLETIVHKSKDGRIWRCAKKEDFKKLGIKCYNELI